MTMKLNFVNADACIFLMAFLLVSKKPGFDKTPKNVDRALSHYPEHLEKL